MATNNVIDRSGASALMPEEYSTKFLTDLQSESAVLSTFGRIPVSRAQVRVPVLSALPHAYWLSGDTGLKQTTQVDWTNKYLNIEEIAVIVPVPDNVIADSEEPIWDRVSPLLVNAAGRLIDETVFFGTEAPETFPTNVVAAAEAVGNEATLGTAEAKAGGIVTDQSEMLTKLETGGFDARTGVAHRTLRGLARNARNTLGDRFGEVHINADSVELDGVTYTFPMRGQWVSSGGSPQAVVYDAEQFIVGIRDDISWLTSKEATIQDSEGNVVFNLFQQDMTALRLTMRVGWLCANVINYEQPVEGQRYPAGVLLHS